MAYASLCFSRRCLLQLRDELEDSYLFRMFVYVSLFMYISKHDYMCIRKSIDLLYVGISVSVCVKGGDICVGDFAPFLACPVAFLYLQNFLSFTPQLAAPEGT